MKTTSYPFLCNGHSEREEPVVLKAGHLSMIFENGSLRYIKAGKTELLRMIYAAVRDSEWLTIKPEISGLKIESDDKSFSLRYDCKYSAGEIDFRASYSITGNPDNRLTLTLEGYAAGTTRKNRIGFCVLHPVEESIGKPCVIKQSGGTVTEAYFPEEISQHQVFRDIKEMSWPAAGGRCTLKFDGDIFETEDQRNWSDNSFKTYSTPLSIPYPVTIDPGSRICQKIEFLAENISTDQDGSGNCIKISINPDDTIRLPQIGLAQSSRKTPLSDSELRLLRSLRIDHYRINVHLFMKDWETSCETGIREAEFLSCSCEFALFINDNYMNQIEGFLEWCRISNPDVSVIHLFHIEKPVTPDHILENASPAIRRLFTGARITSGTNANFVQLNRARPEARQADMITFSIHPQEHASDNLTLIENLKGQEYVAETAAGIYGKKGVWVSPVNLQRRFNANLGYYEKPYDGADFPPSADRRIMTLFGAAWTAISIKYLSENGVSGITYYESAGEKGIIQGAFPSRWPDSFPAKKGMIFPVYFILKYILRHKSMRILKTLSSDPLSSDALVLTDSKQIRMILVNFSGEKREVSIEGCRGTLKIMELNSGNIGEAVTNPAWKSEESDRTARSGNPFIINPCSIAFIEGWLL